MATSTLPSGLPITSRVSREHVEQAVQNAYIWFYCRLDDGQARYDPVPYETDYSRYSWRDHVPDDGFTKEELALVDTRLADVLDREDVLHRSTALGSTGPSNWNFYGVDMRYNLQRWRGELLQLPYQAFVAGQKIVMDQSVGCDDLDLTLFRDNDSEERLVIGYDSCCFGTVKQPTHYINSHRVLNVELNIGWMDQHFPCWREQVAIAAALDVRGEELRQMVFPSAHRPVSPPQSLGEQVQFE